MQTQKNKNIYLVTVKLRIYIFKPNLFQTYFQTKYFFKPTKSFWKLYSFFFTSKIDVKFAIFDLYKMLSLTNDFHRRQEFKVI